MSAVYTEALVQPVRNPFFEDVERRSAPRHACRRQATAHCLETGQPLSWGASVNNVSASGVSLTLCYPFRLGTYLAVEFQSLDGMVRTLMVRVVHVHDRPDGMWRLGCEFIKPLSHSDMDLLI